MGCVINSHQLKSMVNCECIQNNSSVKTLRFVLFNSGTLHKIRVKKNVLDAQYGTKTKW